MASWYVSSVGYAAVAQFATSHAYSVGDIVRQLATPAVGSERCFRCTTAGISGGSEPSWNLTKGATTTSGTAVFTEVTGNSAYNWSAPAARLLLIFNTFAAAGDTIYVAHNHAETQASNMSLTATGTSAAPLYVYCVNAAGSVPPVAADLATTGTISTSAGSFMVVEGFFYCYGLTFSSADSLYLTNGTSGLAIYENCLLKLNNATGSARITEGLSAYNNVVLINTPCQFGATGQGITINGSFTWRNTPSAIAGTVPTTLFLNSSNVGGVVRLDGVDLSAAGSGKTIFGATTHFLGQFSMVNCKLGASVSITAALTGRNSGKTDLVVSDSGATGYRQEHHQYEGDLTTETSITRSGGATDGVQAISWKVVTTSVALPLFPFQCFPIAAWNTAIGSPVTATIEIESTAALQDGDIWMLVEYLGTSGFPVASVVSSGLATPLSTPANLSASSEAWNGGLGGAVKQKMSVSFTPQLAGLVRATVYVGKASQTVYIDPKLTLS